MQRLRRRRNNALAFVFILGLLGVGLLILTASGLVVFVPVVLGVALYALIARFFFRVFRVDISGRKPEHPEKPGTPET